MKIDKEVALKLLKEFEKQYPKIIDVGNNLVGTLNKNKTPSTILSDIFVTNETLSAKDQQRAYIYYLEGEGLVQKTEVVGRYTITSKAINLLTDGIDMETWIKKSKPV